MLISCNTSLSIFPINDAAKKPRHLQEMRMTWLRVEIENQSSISSSTGSPPSPVTHQKTHFQGKCLHWGSQSHVGIHLIIISNTKIYSQANYKCVHRTSWRWRRRRQLQLIPPPTLLLSRLIALAKTTFACCVSPITKQHQQQLPEINRVLLISLLCRRRVATPPHTRR